MYVFIKAMLFKEIVMRDYLEQAYEVIRDQCKKKNQCKKRRS